MSNPTILMIRPLPQAQDFMRDFCDQTGLSPNVIYAPVLAIRQRPIQPLPTTPQFLLFSSVNGVTHFASQTSDRSVPVLCTGETTLAAAQAEGFSGLSANGTAADLVALAREHANPDQGPLVYVSGDPVAQPIDETLAAHGFATLRCVVYEQSQQPLTSEARAALRGPTCIPITSPNTAQAFADQTRTLDLSNVTCLCISKNASMPLSATNAKIVISDAPTRAAMLTALAGCF